MRELTEESGIDRAQVRVFSPLHLYIEYGRLSARPEKHEPARYHLDIGFACTAAVGTQVGRIQESEVAAATRSKAERLVGPRIARAVEAPIRGS
nr:hypothetical protein [Nocardiopsis sp. JB363]